MGSRDSRPLHCARAGGGKGEGWRGSDRPLYTSRYDSRVAEVINCMLMLCFRRTPMFLAESVLKLNPGSFSVKTLF